MNISQISKDLYDIYEKLKAGAIDRNTADTMSNTLGKIANNHRNQVAYEIARTNLPEMRPVEFYEPAPVVIEGSSPALPPP